MRNRGLVELCVGDAGVAEERVGGAGGIEENVCGAGVVQKCVDGEGKTGKNMGDKNVVRVRGLCKCGGRGGSETSGKCDRVAVLTSVLLFTKLLGGEKTEGKKGLGKAK